MIVTGSGGLIGSEAVAPLRRAGLRRGRDRERHARALLRRRTPRRRAPPQRLLRAVRRQFRSRRARHPRRRRRRRACSRGTRRELELVIHTAAQPSHDWAATRPARPTSRVNANGTLNLLEATRRHAARRDVHLHARPTRSTATRRTACRWWSSASGSSCPRTTATSAASTPTMSIDRSHALAVRRLEGRGRPDGPGVRPLLRHADGLLPRRLPDRARTTPARSCTASSSYLMRCTVTGEPVHGLRLRRQAGARQHPQPPTSCARSRRSTRARAPAAVYNLGGGRESNCSMLEAIAALRARSPGATLDWTLVRRGAAMGDHRWWISDLAPFRRDYPELGARRTTSRTTCARSTTRTSSAGRRSPR